MRARTLLAAAAFGLAGMLVPTVTASAAPTCADPSAPLTVEEQRLAQPKTAEVLQRSGFDRFAQVFTPALCAYPNAHVAEVAIRAQGRALWEAAVARAQGRLPAGTLPVTDDRPLYWARLQLTKALRQWAPRFELTPEARTGLVDALERSSRGQDSIAYPGRALRILVSGFDPFQLDQDIRRSNPSGATALALDGTVIDTPAGRARIETAVFPVLWDPFAAGVVERTFAPVLGRVDMFTTISQGRVGRFDVERYNGRWRGGFPDNDNISRTGVAPIPPGVPTVTPAPEFVPTTLPYAAIVAAPTGRFPVFDNTSVTEIPAGQTAPVVSPTGPTPGSVARAGGGGDYLSNEIAYRATLLRDALGLHIPGGHLHTPVLQFDPANTTELTDPTFATNQLDIVNQVRAVLTVAAGTL
ncbi:pyroglutamyl peptidase [Actinophytocola oryzae]|uniref:Pyrrolidone-carboxylate peptidase n=1 Tax=Actinophytocola oryzae TaxID=502181 RepID=A0A4V3FS52_9PSEU|nr:pyroglutamyl peptidase [Actinophytocola oryzae]TDV46091.1 pyrrolidone-carboxylate peptidase [Actinophytocola oryzae]